MTGPQKTLLAIALFIALALGGFVWFVTQWTATHKDSANARPFLLLKISWGELANGQGGQSPQTPAAIGATA